MELRNASSLSTGTGDVSIRRAGHVDRTCKHEDTVQI